MTSLIKKFKAARAEKKAKKPRRIEITTSDFVETGAKTNRLTGRSSSISMTAHFTARSKTKVDPQKGPDSVLWDIHEKAAYGGQQVSEPVKLGIAHKDMLAYMLAAEKEAAGQESRPDAKFIEERRPLVAKNNILKFV